MLLELDQNFDISETLANLEISTATDFKFSSICADSRKVKNSSLFIACQGEKIDGHNFIPQALQQGASVVLAERKTINDPRIILVSNTRYLLAKLAELCLNSPTKQMRIAGITGTNGKTTTNWLVYNALRRNNLLALRSGTIGIYAEGFINQESLTTADPLFLHNVFARAYKKEFNHAVLEVSSHGLVQERVSGISFDTIAFTNLTRDHLDYHNNFESYYLAKRRLFELLEQNGKGLKLAVVNKDCPYGARLLNENFKIETLSFGAKDAEIECALHYQDLRRAVHSLKYKSQSYQIESTFFGQHNSQNFATAFGLLLGLGLSADQAIFGLDQMPSVPGRLEFIAGPGFSVFVDYAHTPDALENALKALRPLVKNRLWVVFGCGGDRDPGKRPIMGKICQDLADKIVVTSDNPRTEKPEMIINDILAGCQPELVEADRKEAIIKVLSQAQSGDVILIAGKGHEDYQIIGTQKTHFSDQEITRAALGKA